MAIAMRVPLLLFASLLTVVSFAAPAQANAECGLSAQGPASLAGGTCDAVLPTGNTIHACVGLLTTDNYVNEDEVEVDGWGTRTTSGCQTGSEGPAGCQAWALPPAGLSGWIYPNAGVDCVAAGAPVQHLCAELLPEPWAFAFNVDDFWGSGMSDCQAP